MWAPVSSVSMLKGQLVYFSECVQLPCYVVGQKINVVALSVLKKAHIGMPSFWLISYDRGDLANRLANDQKGSKCINDLINKSINK